MCCGQQFAATKKRQGVYFPNGSDSASLSDSLMGKLGQQVGQDLRQDMLSRVVSALKEINLNQPGMAYFQGTIYTEGDFVAKNEVKILGGLYAVGPNSDVRFENHVEVTYVPEIVRQAGTSLGNVGVKQWLRR